MTKVVSVGRPVKSSQKLSKQLILRTALPIVQKGGVEGLSFRVLAEQLGVTPMAVTYHAGSKKQLLSDLVELAFEGVLDDIEGDPPIKRARSILATYYGYALKNAKLLRPILTDVTLMSEDLVRVAVELKTSTDRLDNLSDLRLRDWLSLDSAAHLPPKVVLGNRLRMLQMPVMWRIRIGLGGGVHGE